MTSQFKMLRINASSMLSLFHAGAYELKDNPLPADTAIVDVAVDRSTRTILLTLWSVTFPVVPSDEIIPDIEKPIMRRLK